MTILKRCSNWTVGSSKHQPDKRLTNLTSLCRHSSAAQYTRILRIRGIWFETPGPFLPPSMQPSWSFLKKKRKYAIDYFSRNIIPLLVSVDELTLLPNRDEFPNGSLPLLSDILWMSLKPRLRKLNYKGTIEALQRILSPSPRYNFNPPPSLTHLVISFRIHLEWPAIPIADKMVFVTFLRGLEPTLQSLSLRIPGQLTSILPKLPHFPRLEHLDIRLDTYQISSKAGVAFSSFLSTHREYLKTLTLCMYPDLVSVQIYRDFCNISFPFLHTLALDCTQDFVEQTQAFPHVPRLQRFVSGGRHPDQETMIKIRERTPPSQPSIILGRSPFDSDLDAELGHDE